MDTFTDSCLAALREELEHATDPRIIADLQAEIARCSPPENARSVPSAFTR